MPPDHSASPPPATAAGHGADLIIRAREREDAEAIAELLSLPKVRWGTLRLPFRSREEVRKWLETSPEQQTVIVAQLDGKLVGVADVMQYKGRRSHAGGFGMSVHDDFQGRGIGSALLAALVDVADNWLNLRRLELTVYVDNAAAIALYRKFSFVIEGTRRSDAFRDGAFADSYMMARLNGL